MSRSFWLTTVLLCVAVACVAQQDTGPGVSSPPLLGFSFARFDTLRPNEILLRHAFSLDNLLEYEPGYFLVRLGPIGGEAGYSRHGIGLGRGAVYLGAVPLNDPQNDVAPLALVPSTSVGTLVFDDGSSTFLPGRSNIEGTVRILEPEVPLGHPNTAIELARGDHGLRQRRVRFSSPERSVGVDLSFDELLNNGYPYDAREIISGPDYGSSVNRMLSLSLRGTLADGERYVLSFRRFDNEFRGDLDALENRRLRDGHIGRFEAAIGDVLLSLYQRRYDVEAPDSVTQNLTTGVVASVPYVRGDIRLSLGAAYESIQSEQRVGGGRNGDGLRKASAGFRGNTRLGNGFGLRFAVDLAHYLGGTTGWGGRVAVARHLGAHWQAAALVGRSFRMPNLGELYLPDHSSSGTTRLIGNPFLDSENLIEAGARLFAEFEYIQNEVRISAMRVGDPIIPIAVTVDSVDYQSRANRESENLLVVEDRFRVEGRLWRLNAGLVGGVQLASGERERFFAATPQTRINATATLGASLFKNSSEFLVAAEYQRTSARKTLGQPLDAFDVLNLRLNFRLIDAWLYVAWLNVFDEKYQTIAPFLMEPKTFVYGIAWTLFD